MHYCILKQDIIFKCSKQERVGGRRKTVGGDNGTREAASVKGSREAKRITENKKTAVREDSFRADSGERITEGNEC